jgi:hypothetical protein
VKHKDGVRAQVRLGAPLQFQAGSGDFDLDHDQDVQVGDTFWLRAMPAQAWEVTVLTSSGLARLESGAMWAFEAVEHLLDERGSWLRADHVREVM